MNLDYAIYDVFSDQPLAGNPLAVILDATGIDVDRMQAIAREFNLSETVFILPAEEAAHTARLRIFNPRTEMPFAGHPTVGAAIALAEHTGQAGSAIQMLEERIGPVRTAVTLRPGEAPFAEFDLPRLPQSLSLGAKPAEIAAALGLDPQEIGFENHRIGLWTAGMPYVMVPVDGLAAAGGVNVNAEAWTEIGFDIGPACPAPFVYCRETVRHDCAFHARVFAPWDGIGEDPATGSAVAAFAGQIMRLDEPVDGPSHFWIEQGVEMGRPSRIRLEIDVARGEIAAARIGGNAVLVARGELRI